MVYIVIKLNSYSNANIYLSLCVACAFPFFEVMRETVGLSFMIKGIELSRIRIGFGLNLWWFWYRKKAHIFLLTHAKFYIENCSVWIKILMKMCLVMVIIIKLTQQDYIGNSNVQNCIAYPNCITIKSTNILNQHLWTDESSNGKVNYILKNSEIVTLYGQNFLKNCTFLFFLYSALFPKIITFGKIFWNQIISWKVISWNRTMHL